LERNIMDPTEESRALNDQSSPEHNFAEKGGSSSEAEASEDASGEREEIVFDESLLERPTKGPGWFFGGGGGGDGEEEEA
jgi:hypothetical protein